MPAVLAIAAHPDDIEFLMAGTLLLLGQAGWDLHYLNLSTGNCGSADIPAARLRRQRAAEARSAARVLGATWHAPVADDLEILYSVPLLRKVAAVVRRVRPSIVLTHAWEDYMEDHMQTARLAVTAAFARGMPNFRTTPTRRIWNGDVRVYHALPHGLRDPLGRRVSPGAWVNTTLVQDRKREALACHASQGAWLDTSQGMSSYLTTMDDLSREMGRQSGRFTYGEGWTAHNALGMGDPAWDPLREALGSAWLGNPAWAAAIG